MSGAIPSKFRALLRAGNPLVGSFVNLGSPLTAEIMAVAGFDWLVLDLEHGGGGEQEVLAQLQAVEHSGVATLVRVERIERSRFVHALDRGATGILVPQINGVDDARRCVDYCRYSGSRGVARYNRSWHWGLASRPLADVDDEIICAVQIETPSALEAVNEIAAIDGIDVLFVGPVDLGHSLGIVGGVENPELRNRIAEVARAAQANAKVAGILVGTLEQAAVCRELGFSFIGCSSDSGLLALEARRIASGLNRLREAAVV